MKNTFDIQSPKLEEDTEEVIKLWFAEKKLSPPSKTWRLYVAESKYVSNMVSTVRSIRKKWLWILMKRVPNRRKRESQIGGREKCDFFVYNMEEKLVFPVDTCYLCVSDSNDVPNLVVTMHFRQEKRLESRIGRSQGVRSTDPLPRASGLVEQSPSERPIRLWSSFSRQNASKPLGWAHHWNLTHKNNQYQLESTSTPRLWYILGEWSLRILPPLCILWRGKHSSGESWFFPCSCRGV